MKKIRLLLVLFVAVFACSKEEPLPTTGNIRGKITDAQNSSPLRDVNVEIGGNSYTTGSDGSYFFNDLPERSYTVSVLKSGYIADSKSVMVRADQTSLADFVLSKNLPTVEPASVTISTEEGSKSVTLRNTQAEPIGFSTQSSKPWITVSPGSGTIAGNSQTIVSITIAFDQIEFGTFNENIVINVSGSSLNIPVVAVKSQPSFINILQPEEDGVYAPEEIMPIRWESNLGGAVDINLLKTGNSSIFRIIQESVPNSNGGTYNWSLPEIEQGFYRVQVVSKENVSVSDITGNFFIGDDPNIPFIERDQEFSYVEDQQAGFVIGTLSATDDKGIEQFQFVSGNSPGYFAISSAGRITLTSQGVNSPANDYEQTPNEFTLSVKAYDADGNESASTPVVIKVVDFDDEPPVVEANQSFTYSEGRPANFVLGKIEASDDVGIAAFNIVSGNDQGYFTVNGLGELRLTTAGLTSPANDYEQAPNSFTIAVTAADQSGNVSEAVSINIIVVNSDENPPNIEPNQSFAYQERQAVNYEIGTVASTDDVGVTDYEIISGNTQGYFAVSNTGVLTLTAAGASINAASNDFEVLPNTFSIGITAIDVSGNTSSQTQITIQVLDVDDIGFNGIFFKDSNGITIKCEQCNPGDRGSVDGVIYTAVSEEMLREMIANNEDVTKVVTSLVTNGEKLFFQKANFNQDIGSWDTSNFTSMALMFSGSEYQGSDVEMAFNQDISAWDTSNVTNMDSMFFFCKEFDRPLGEWDTSSVTNMNGMFREARSFNQDISEWDVGNVKQFAGTFLNAHSFNQPIGSWDMSSTERVRDMFWYALSFDQPLNDWDVSSIWDFAGMFNGARLFNQPLNNWDTSSAVEMHFMFNNAHAFNQDISNWDVSNVVLMAHMFDRARSFNQPLNSWDTRNVDKMQYMFHGATSFNQPLNNWNTSKVTSMEYMFSGEYQNHNSFDQDLSSWDVSNVTNMTQMFGFSSFNQPIGNWDVGNVTSMHLMFYLTPFNQPIGNWNVSNVRTMSGMLRNTPFNQDISSWDVSSVENMAQLFLVSDFNKDISEWDVSNVANMDGMFLGSVFNQDISSWDVSNVTNMNSMFRDATKFNKDISSWCVEKISSEPVNFAVGSGLQNDYYPIWGSCPEGESEAISYGFELLGNFTGSNYYFLDQNKTFFEAKELADQFGADLLTITSQEEQDYLKQRLTALGLTDVNNYNWWLGLTDEENEGQWRWLNGEAFSYSNWAPNEPNNQGGNEDYVHMYGDAFSWNDHRANATPIKVILEFK